VLDVPSGLGLWSWNAVYVSDLVVIPVQADEAAERGLTQTVEWIRSIVRGFRHDTSVDSLVRLVMTIVDRDNRILTEMLRDHIRSDYPRMTLSVEIRKRAAASQARAAHLPIFHFAESDGSRGARETVEDFERLTREVAAHERNVEKGTAAEQKRGKAIGE
jgi:cellulose biosynthesis protein BcsQ